MPKSLRPNRGFTMVEISVVILVLAMLAAIVVPQYVAFQRGSIERSFMLELPALAQRARNQAVRTGSTMSLTFSESERNFGLQLEDEEESSPSLSLPERSEVDRVKIGSDESAGGDWSLRFFSDGSSQGGSLQLLFDGRPRTFQIDRQTSSTRWLDGEIPESSNERWQAGEIEIRGQAGAPR